MVNLIIVDRDHNHAIPAQKMSSGCQARKHHGQPRSMLTASTLNVRGRRVALVRQSGQRPDSRSSDSAVPARRSHLYR